MDIGPEQPPFIAEPIEDPFKKRPKEPARPVPQPAPTEEPVPA